MNSGPLGIVPPAESLDEELPLLPPKKATSEALHWYDVPSKSMLAGMLLFVLGIVAAIGKEQWTNQAEEMKNLQKAVEQAQGNLLNRVAIQASVTEVKVNAMKEGMGKLTEALEDNTKVQEKVLIKLARIEGVLAAKGIDR